MLKECIINEIYSNICTNPIYIYQYNFAQGPYIISQPGLYILMENIEVNFFKTKQSAFQFNQNDKFGHSAAIKIECDNVILDLNNYYLRQSPQDYCVQRFFALIQLNSMPFNPNVGPITIEKRTILRTANNCIIKNGKLQLSAHQSILGNNNENIILENLQCEDFEVSGITLNNTSNTYIENCIIGQSLGGQYKNGMASFVPLTPFFAGLSFNHKLLSSILDDNSIVRSEIDNIIMIKTIEKINNILDPVLSVIYSYKTLAEIFNNLVKLSDTSTDIKLLVNLSGLSPCNIHGIKITGKNPSIGSFHTSVEQQETDTISNTYSSNININNIIIRNLIAEINERIILSQNGNIINIAAGLKLTHEVIDTEIGKYLTNAIYDLITNNSQIKGLIKSNLTEDIINFINNNINNGTIGFKRSMDIMGHINKGVIGMRLGSIKHACLNNIKIHNITNIGKKMSDIEIEKYINLYDGINDIYMMDTTLLSPLVYSGSYSIGYIISGCKNIDNKLIKIYDIKSPESCSIGFCINNLCNDILLDNSNIYDIVSSDSCNDSTILLIDYKSKSIKINDTNFN